MIDRQAKMDSLSGLAACVEAWGIPAVAPHLGRIWWGLRDELVDPMVPTEADGGGVNTAVAAATCLRRCIAAQQGREEEAERSRGLLEQVWNFLFPLEEYVDSFQRIDSLHSFPLTLCRG